MFPCNDGTNAPAWRPDGSGYGHHVKTESVQWPASRVRSTFINFFMEKKQHTHVVSSPVVPHLEDKSLLFTNAGMNQFKPIFLGKIGPTSTSPLAKLKRACNTQKCIRAGGKHNDLDDVGKDVYHHTCFEMLGNWSFGDYFKREAITWAWELLTEVYGLDPSRLYATYFKGDDSQGLKADEEAKAIWLEVLPESRVLPFDCKDNFWEMGNTGPCGPCTEIHYDRIGGRDAAALVNMDDPDVLEIWNLVFIQFNREEDASLKLLPKQHVDTGMGFERLVSCLQDKSSNYDTDVFTPIFHAIQQITGAPQYTGKVGAEDIDGKDMAYRVVADHIRTLSIAIADGAQPGNDGRNYVLRRILRRAVRYGSEVLGAPSGFFNKLVDVVCTQLGDIFPELVTKKEFVREVLLDEEMSFGKTLSKGIEMFKKMMKKSEATKQISGQEAFTLWDTFGFPVDLTELMAEENGFVVDSEGFEKALAEAKDLSKGAQKKGAGVALKMEAEATGALANMGVKPSDDSFKYIWNKDVTTSITAILTTGGFVQSTEGVEVGAPVGLVLGSTPFYAESGGQIFDIGTITSGDTKMKVTEVKMAAGYVLHQGVLESGMTLKVGDSSVASVDYARRSLIAANHTCTHVLNHALRKVLGNTVDQKGALYDDEKLRFDFSQSKAVDVDSLRQVEQLVKKAVADKLVVYSQEASLAPAKEICTLRAVFGEQYPDPVRVVSVGVPIEDLLAKPANTDWMEYSVEFCGGTHLNHTGEAEEFVLLAEEGIAKGVRRVTGLTKGAARAALAEAAKFQELITAAEGLEGSALEKAVNSVKVNLDTAVMPTVRKAELKEQLTKLQKKIAEAAKKAAAGNKRAFMEAAKQGTADAQAAGKPYCVVYVDVTMDPGAIREAVMAVIKEGKTAIAFLAVDADKDKVMVYTGVPPSISGLDCLEWLKAGLGPVNGKGGGGKGGMAQGQASGAAQVDACIAACTAFAQNAVGA